MSVGGGAVNAFFLLSLFLNTRIANAAVPVYEGWNAFGHAISGQAVDEGPTRWIVSLEAGTDIEAVCDLSDLPCPCSREESASLAAFWYAVVSCTTLNGIHDLVTHLENSGYQPQYVEKEQMVAADQRVSEPLFMEQASAACASQQPFSFPQIDPPNWGLDRCDQSSPVLDNSFTVDRGLTGCGVHIYVLDTGLNVDHQDFAGRVLEGKDFTDSGGVEDDNGHGTHCTGIAAGRQHGVAKGAWIHPVKVLDKRGAGTSTAVLGGLAWVVEHAQTHHEPVVMSLSFASPFSVSVNEVMKIIHDDGLVVVVAAGNFRKDACGFSPSSSPHVLTVGATEISGTTEDVRSDFSNFGSCIDVWAPGTDVKSTWKGGPTSTNFLSGTSMAAPHYTGMAALYLAERPTALASQVFDALKFGSQQVPSILSGDSRPGDSVLMCNVNGIQSCQPAINCEVSEWGEWSTCPAVESACGRQSRVRRRSITRQPHCGGAPCGPLIEYQECSFIGLSYPACDGNIPAQFFEEGSQSPANSLLVLTPQADDAYGSCIDKDVSKAPEGGGPGIRLNIGDDGSQEIFFGARTFKFFGREYGSVHIGSNGYLTFGVGDFRYRSVVGSPGGKEVRSEVLGTFDVNIDDPLVEAFSGPPGSPFASVIQGFVSSSRGLKQDRFSSQALEAGATHWDIPRISMWFQDLNPKSDDENIGYELIFDEASKERIIVNYVDVPCYSNPGAKSSFQVVLWMEGSERAGQIEIWWGDLSNCGRPVVGLSPGFTPPNWQSTDLLTEIEQCTAPRPPPPSGGSGGGGGGFSFFS